MSLKLFGYVPRGTFFTVEYHLLAKIGLFIQVLLIYVVAFAQVLEALPNAIQSKLHPFDELLIAKTGLPNFVHDVREGLEYLLALS